MRFTIERLRALVLAAGVLLIAALVVFFAIDKWKSPLNRRDLPKRLGVDIQQEARGFTYTQARGGHTLFRIQASKVVQLKEGNALLHEVHIEIFDPKGNRADSIQGNEFEYNQQAGTAKANGPVEITLTRPANASAVASSQGVPVEQIHVKTSGLVFDQNSGLASTQEPVEFLLAEGSGSAVGATFDSEQGLLVLDRSVKMDLRHGGGVAELEATHADFERTDQVVRLANSVLHYRGNQMESATATIHFRSDGSASQLDVAEGFSLTSAAGSHATAPTGIVQFDDDNHPRSGFLSGGVTLDSVTQGRNVHVNSPTARLAFSGAGVLQTAHLEQGVKLVSNSREASSHGEVTSSMTWTAPVTDLQFTDTGDGKAELAAIRGSGGVLVKNRSQRGVEPVTLSNMAADLVTGTFGPGSALTSMTGQGHARIEQTTTTGMVETTSGDRLVVSFLLPKAGNRGKAEMVGGMAIDSATVEDHVVLTEVPVEKSGAKSTGPSRATGSKAVYRSATGRITLTGNPRVEDGDMQLSAEVIEIMQMTGDAHARGDVKATWLGGADRPMRAQATNSAGSFVEQGPTHAIAEEVELHRSTDEVELRGHARLWQGANSISAPLILLNRMKQTLVAHATGTANPVQVVMVSESEPLSTSKKPSQQPSVIRMQGGNLKYSAAERKVVMYGGILGKVQVETADMESASNDVEVYLLPPGNHAGKNGSSAQVDKFVAHGSVTLTAQGRIGVGEQLAYGSDTGEYVLTGTSSQPPRLSDPVRGSVTGEILIFNSRDDSVKVESARGRTTTQSAAPRARLR